MIITAEQKYIRQTPRKLRLIANTVKKLSLEQAIKQLAVIERRATLPVVKVVKQAIANAVNNHGLNFADLVLRDIIVTEGPRYKRFNAVSRGRAHEIKKRTSHVLVRLVTKEVA
jgi:large subunit ribosomal protein L22